MVLICIMDLEQTSRELVRAVRGHRSQPALSRRLGYRTNVLYAWESGHRSPLASEVLRLAASVGVDVRGAFVRFYRTAPDWLLDADVVSPEFVSRFLRDLQGEAAVALIARRANRNRFSVARWLSGEAQPRLAEFLSLVEAASLRVVDLLAALVDPAKLPSITEVWTRREAGRSLAIECPWAVAVLRCLEVSSADGDTAAIATRLRLPLEEVERSVAMLSKAGLVTLEAGRWRPVAVEAVDSRRSQETARRIKGFWGRVGLDRLEGGSDGAFAYNVMSVSESQLHRLRELHDGYFNAVRAVVAAEEAPECVVLLNLQLLRLDDGA